MTQESCRECMRLLGIKGLEPNLPQWEFLMASCPELLREHPEKIWWFQNKMRLRDELLFVLNELGPVEELEIAQSEQNQEPIPLHSKKDMGR